MGKAVALAIGKKAIVVDLHGLEVNLYVLFEETAEFWFDLFVLSSSKLAGHLLHLATEWGAWTLRSQRQISTRLKNMEKSGNAMWSRLAKPCEGMHPGQPDQTLHSPTTSPMPLRQT